jgi:hypothetical protein
MQKEAAILSAATTGRKRSPKDRLIHLGLLSRWLSLDVAAGALVSCLMVCRLMGVTPFPWQAAGVLSGTVLAIYTFDHLLDVWHTQGQVFSSRRWFHWQYRKELMMASIFLCFLLGLSAILYLPLTILYFGSALAVMVAAYLWLVKWLGESRGKAWFHKELLIACLYTVGIWGVAYTYSSYFLVVHVYLFISFGLIALQNLLLFSNFELEEDKKQKQRSMVLYLGSRKMKVILYMLVGLVLLFLLLSWTKCTLAVEKQVIFTEALMSATLLVLQEFPGYFVRHKRYRWLGDGVFLLPAWLLF